jgi:hypothetical protein
MGFIFKNRADYAAGPERFTLPQYELKGSARELIFCLAQGTFKLPWTQ